MRKVLAHKPVTELRRRRCRRHGRIKTNGHDCQRRASSTRRRLICGQRNAHDAIIMPSLLCRRFGAGVSDANECRRTQAAHARTAQRPANDTTDTGSYASARATSPKPQTQHEECGNCEQHADDGCVWFIKQKPQTLAAHAAVYWNTTQQIRLCILLCNFYYMCRLRCGVFAHAFVHGCCCCCGRGGQKRPAASAASHHDAQVVEVHSLLCVRGYVVCCWRFEDYMRRKISLGCKLCSM